MIHFNTLGQHVVVLNSVQASVELLEKRGAKYSDRPSFALFEVMGWKNTLTFLPWGAAFRMHRRLLHTSFTKTQCVQYQTLQMAETHRAIKSIFSDPSNWDLALRRFTSAVVLRIGFGVKIRSNDDPYIQIATDASYALGRTGVPGGTPLDFFPLLRFFPSWLARSKSLKFARDWNWAIRRIHDVPFVAAQRAMAEGTAQPSFIRHQLEHRAVRVERGESVEMTLEDIKGAAGAIFAAGQGTTWSTVVVFILSMLLHPEIQRRAQAEIDAVIGSTRLPEFSDRPSLPYLEYVLQETLRWGPVSPMGVPHKSMEDDVYNGMFIPKGSLVYANARAMCYDEKIYKDPDTFNPMRFAPVSEGGNDEPLPIGPFGFGRRICPGRHLADTTLWFMLTTMLATMSIDKSTGLDGEEITPRVAFSPGITSHPEPFTCVLRPRSQLAKELISNTVWS